MTSTRPSYFSITPATRVAYSKASAGLREKGGGISAKEGRKRQRRQRREDERVDRAGPDDDEDLSVRPIDSTSSLFPAPSNGVARSLGNLRSEEGRRGAREVSGKGRERGRKEDDELRTNWDLVFEEVGSHQRLVSEDTLVVQVHGSRSHGERKRGGEVDAVEERTRPG